jgi:REP element-mobilizing transposase RayT
VERLPLLQTDALKAMISNAADGMVGRGAERVAAWVVMPDHVHLLFDLARDYTLAQVVGSFKKYSARRANELLDRRGAFWQTAYFEHAVRNERDYSAWLEYMYMNPVRAGLVALPEEYPWFHMECE